MDSDMVSSKPHPPIPADAIKDSEFVRGDKVYFLDGGDFNRLAADHF